MDIQFWIWLIVIVITLIARANKKKPRPFEPEQNVPQDQSDESKPITFEDLLREIQSAKSPKSQTIVPVKPEVKKVVQPSIPSVIDYDDNLEEESKTLEQPKYYADDKIYETYENAKKEAFSRASLEETMRVEDTVVKFSPFKEFNKREIKGLAVEYANELKNPKNFKRALILSEILNRKF